MYCQNARVSNIGMIRLGSESQGIRFSAPSASNKALAKPRDSLKNQMPITPIVTPGSTAGMKKVVRKKPRNSSHDEVRSKAR